ncbi:MAG TPA: hypothetical protein PKD24_07620 [Pyrinomonadaceae bacterium]|nr:hypothetical protein [Pyrinomonadaceae bacterium]
MGLFEGKTREERNKMIAAMVLGVLAVASLLYAFGPGFLSRGSSVATQTKPSPTPRSESRSELTPVELPSDEDQARIWEATPVLYRPGVFGAPDPGRNIFAFYEPPPPTPWQPTPTPFVVLTPPPTPTPPPILISFVTPQSIFAGSRTFRIEVVGDRIPADARIYFSQNQLPTTFISPQRLTAEVPANFIATEGPRQIIVQTPDGRLYSNQIMLNVQAPPRPQFQYIGMIARRHANNDTAYFREQGQTEFGARLNDVVGGRFRLVSIASDRVVFEDVNLGFRHTLEMYRPPPGTLTSTLPPAGRTPPGVVQRGLPPGFEGAIPVPNPGANPGIPQPIVPSNTAPRPMRTPNERKDEDDEDGTDGRR